MNNRPAVLVVDDNADVCSLYAKLLRARGFDVDTCRDPDDALAHLRDTRYEVFVVEPAPAAGLLPLVARLRSEQRMPSVVVTTTESDAGLSRELANAGVFKILRKPVARHELGDAVEQCLRARG